jgi:hypothetical protein
MMTEGNHSRAAVRSDRSQDEDGTLDKQPDDEKLPRGAFVTDAGVMTWLAYEVSCVIHWD